MTFRLPDANDNQPAWRRWWVILLWLTLASLLVVTSFHYLEQKHQSERASVGQIARKETQVLAAAYAVQLSHTVEQLDRDLLNLKYFYENAPGLVDLQKQVRKGMYPMAGQLYVSILDADGTLVDSSVPNTLGANLASQEFFQIHGQNRDAGLSITKHNDAPGVSVPVVRFSRRLENEQGKFLGVVSIAVEPRLLGSFYDQTALGRGDFVTVRSTAGKILSTKMGEKIQSYTAIFRKSPVFDRPIGVARYPATQFNDNEARLYAWNTLAKYPLISTVGLLEADVYADLNKKVAQERLIGTVASYGLLLLTLVGMTFNYLYLKRRHESESIKQSYQLAIEGAEEGFFSLRAMKDLNGDVIDFLVDECNDRGAGLFGLRRADVAGAKLSFFYGDHDRQRVINIFVTAMENGFLEDEFNSQDAAGHSRRFHRRLVRSRNGLAVTVRDISEAKRYEAGLHDAANRDALTGLNNRHWLMGFLPQAVERTRHNGQQMALFFIDLDNFKEVNNTLGHGAGDQLLMLAAQRFRTLVRPIDHVVRLGGDEFTIILENAGQVEIVEIAERIIDGFTKPFQLDSQTIGNIRASIGIAICPEDGTSADALLHRADTAMYGVKESGKAHYRFYRNDTRSQAPEFDS